MPESKVYKRGRGQIAFNMTPMIDCTFQLIIFFILTTQIASQDYVQLNLPSPDRNVAREYELDKVIVNVVPYSKENVRRAGSELGKPSPLLGRAEWLRLGLDRFRVGPEWPFITREAVDMYPRARQIDKLVRRLTGARRKHLQEGGEKQKELVVEVRADRSIAYVDIEPVLQALQHARLGSMYITVKLGEGG